MKNIFRTPDDLMSFNCFLVETQSIELLDYICSFMKKLTLSSENNAAKYRLLDVEQNEISTHLWTIADS